jgi:hypothetical protein
VWVVAFVALASLVTSAGDAVAQAACAEDPAYAVLDFWVGEWDVRVDGELVGTNRIEKLLEGCAIMEHWTDRGGSEGKSLFYRVPAEDAWKQVWVTEAGTRTGGVKEKLLVEVGGDGSTLFRGEIARSDGTSYFDQTRLTPLGDGSVRQVIEVSRDGSTWHTTFDATYVSRTD